MKKKITLLFIFLGLSVSGIAQNPIYDGLNPYGQRDFHIIYDGGFYYLTATEATSPLSDPKGPTLYRSKDLRKWQNRSLLIDRSQLQNEVWYRDVWSAPEISKIKDKYYLTFNCRNDETDPYGQIGIGIAVCDQIDGKYNVITPKPLTFGNRFTLADFGKEGIWGYWDCDGYLYAAKMKDDLTSFITEPQCILAPYSLSATDKFLDSPSVYFHNGRYYLTYCAFQGGYYCAFALADHPMGPWSAPADNQIFYRSEDQAPVKQRMSYPRDKQYAPPCEIIGNVQLLKDKAGNWKMVYHSEDKYAEPYLCIDNAKFENGRIICKSTLP